MSDFKGVKKMFKKIGKVSLFFTIGFAIVTANAFGNESTSPTVQQLLQQIKDLRAQISQIKHSVDKTREIAINTRIEAAKFKEETLYRLGLWRAKLGEGMMMSISAENAAAKAEKSVKSATEQANRAWNSVVKVEEKFDLLTSRMKEEARLREELQKKVNTMAMSLDNLKTDVSLAKEMAATAKAEADQIIEKMQALEELQKKVNTMAMSLDNLKTDVSLAKEMAATAKAEADQARRETRELAGEVKRNRELFLSKIEKILKGAAKVEEKLKSKQLKLKPKAKARIYIVKKGDSLWRIAGYPNIYNDPAKWKKIFEANKNRIPDPRLLYPGQKLIIPQK
ncbi:hypothetical protein DRI96_01070 [Candidatus Aerophobetes bacterium]|uniref:LysM domain-containing protein n=1 Tax=Aerophobetes bacterium TaxID=2030807 RepID=A0A662DJK4_UNCAE|nr:MAG: hypothetical protein DRI96_01070 [Candidatus Aerophobetes bacterium]